MKQKERSLQDLLQDSYQGLSLHRYKSDRGNSYNLVNLKDLDFLEVVTEDLTKVTLNPLKDRFLLQVEDVIISLRGNLLKAAVVTEKLENTIAGQNLAVFRPKSELDSLYLAILLRSRWMESQLARLYMQSTGTQLLKLSQLRKLEIPLPDLATQKKIGELFLKMEEANQLALKEIEVRENISEAILVNAIKK